MNETLLYVINIGNLILGIICFALLFNRTWRRRREYPREVYLVLIVLEAFVIALLVTSAELLTLVETIQLERLVLVSFVITIVKVGLLWVLWTTRHALYRTGSRHIFGEGRNADEMNVNRNVADHPKEGDYVAERE